MDRAAPIAILCLVYTPPADDCCSFIFRFSTPRFSVSSPFPHPARESPDPSSGSHLAVDVDAPSLPPPPIIHRDSLTDFSPFVPQTWESDSDVSFTVSIIIFVLRQSSLTVVSIFHRICLFYTRNTFITGKSVRKVLCTLFDFEYTPHFWVSMRKH